MRLGRVGAWAIAVGAALAWASPAAAGDPALAREQLKRGYILAHEGHCDQAIPFLAESLRLDPKAITLINLADCEEKTGKLAEATGHWFDARARAASEGDADIEKEAAARAAALDPRLARLTISIVATAPKDAVVSRDGLVLGAPSLGVPLPLDPGPHTLVVKAPGRADATIELALSEGDQRTIEVDVGPPAVPVAPPVAAAAEAPPSPFASPLFIAGAAVAGVGLVVGTVTGVIALGAGSSAKSACPNLVCTPKELDDVHSGRTAGTVSTIAFVVAAAGAGLAVYALVAAPKRPAPAMAVSVGPGALFVRGSF